ncbi:MAG: hypothetical protein BV458_02775 [Thermoplasmata archaeon M9B2D]|nr:MAG: hypothetical protein BV458_02775 [Thermoplasmata archaeon M9B2D]
MQTFSPDIENFIQKQGLKMKHPSLNSFKKSSFILEKNQMKFLHSFFSKTEKNEKMLLGGFVFNYSMTKYFYLNTK